MHLHLISLTSQMDVCPPAKSLSEQYGAAFLTLESTECCKASPSLLTTPHRLLNTLPTQSVPQQNSSTAPGVQPRMKTESNVNSAAFQSQF